MNVGVNSPVRYIDLKWSCTSSAVTSFVFAATAQQFRSSQCLQKLGESRTESLAFPSTHLENPTPPPVGEKTFNVKLGFFLNTQIYYISLFICVALLPLRYPWLEYDLRSSQCWCDGRWWALCSPGRILWWCSGSGCLSLHRWMLLPHPKEWSGVRQQT